MQSHHIGHKANTQGRSSHSVSLAHPSHRKKNYHSLVGPAVLGIVLIVAIVTFTLFRGGSAGKATQQEITALKEECGDVTSMGDEATTLLGETEHLLNKQEYQDKYQNKKWYQESPADTSWTENTYYHVHVIAGTADSLENLAPKEEFEAITRGMNSVRDVRAILQTRTEEVSKQNVNTLQKMNTLLKLVDTMEESLTCMHERLTVIRQGNE